MLSTDFSSFFTRPIDASDIFFGHLYRLSLHLCFYLLAMHLRHHSILRPSTSSPRVSKALATTFHSSINFLYEAIAGKIFHLKGRFIEGESSLWQLS
ncbi:unnamed protein product [Lactuca virosa]|uniref:Uncharacterized protein n=1 Tax=Lactuca virosa TaxID=75947 RepID=A0AAU9M0X0_9ASTR|nr:unnamed protein product [Lactuca virosa]